MWLTLSLAAASPNTNLMIEAGVEIPLGAVDGPRGRWVTAHAGVGLPAILGDPCDYREVDCRDASWWALAGSSRRPPRGERLSQNRTCVVRIRLFGRSGYRPGSRPVYDLM